MAAEGRGIGPWTGRDDDIPRLTGHGQHFNLTLKSFKGPWSSSDCYQSGERVWRGAEEDRMSIPMSAIGGGVRDPVIEIAEEDASARLLGV
jgi:hypothetical protein